MKLQRFVSLYVMAGLDPAIHLSVLRGGGMDGRVEPGHDRRRKTRKTTKRRSKQ